MMILLAVVAGSFVMCAGVVLGAVLAAARVADLQAQVDALLVALDDDPEDEALVEDFRAQLDDWDGSDDL